MRSSYTKSKAEDSTGSWIHRSKGNQRSNDLCTLYFQHC